MSTEVGTEPWLAERSATARPYDGVDPFTIDVVVGKDRTGDGVTYHVVLEPGQRPQLRPGAAPGGASATLELSRTDAEAEARGDRPAVVGYMRGTTKTKGATRPLYEYFRLLD
ncbi:MAG: hypothetical protein R2749_07865 [Acidimicrobiales bacterium]